MKTGNLMRFQEQPLHALGLPKPCQRSSYFDHGSHRVSALHLHSTGAAGARLGYTACSSVAGGGAGGSGDGAGGGGGDAGGGGAGQGDEDAEEVQPAVTWLSCFKTISHDPTIAWLTSVTVSPMWLLTSVLGLAVVGAVGFFGTILLFGPLVDYFLYLIFSPFFLLAVVFAEFCKAFTGSFSRLMDLHQPFDTSLSNTFRQGPAGGRIAILLLPALLAFFTLAMIAEHVDMPPAAIRKALWHMAHLCLGLAALVSLLQGAAGLRLAWSFGVVGALLQIAGPDMAPHWWYLAFVAAVLVVCCAGPLPLPELSSEFVQ